MLLEVKDISLTFGGHQVLAGLSFTLDEGACLGLRGANGAGKSSLLHILSGFIQPQCGRIFFRGQSIEHLPLEARQELGLLRSFQQARHFMQLTVWENLLGSLRMAGAPWQLIWHTAARRHMERVLREGLEIFGLQHVHQTRAGDLPLLESRCLEILRILLQDPQLLLLDEPCAGLNQSHASHIIDAIRTFRPRVAMVIVEHQVSLLHVYCDRQLLLEGGQLHSLG